MTNLASRLRLLVDRPVSGGRWVLYWMTAARRTRFNPALERAVGHARALGLPLVVLEALRCDHTWASERHHRFVIDGMADNAAAFAEAGVTYLPFVERSPGDGKGLLAALATDAAVVVTDDAPAFFLPRMLAAASRRVDVRLEAVEGCCVLPLSASPRSFARAVDFRRHLQRTLPGHLGDLPRADPLAGPSLPRLGALPDAITRRWPATMLASVDLSSLPIDHRVRPPGTPGGARAAESAWRSFLENDLDRYARGRSDVEREARSGLSPYLHFGHISPHQLLIELADHEDWAPDQLVQPARGKREGWWGMRSGAEAFLDQLLTWRELGHVAARHGDAPETWEGVPPWARATLGRHAADPRPHLYSLDELERAETHDALWNAAQRQLVECGTIHNYLRMLWGKKILEWSPTPQAALAAMVELNHRYALDGRDPNSTSGILWVLGRYDRPWGPERSIFGTVRFMSSDNTRRKMRLDGYLRRWGEARTRLS